MNIVTGGIGAVIVAATTGTAGVAASPDHAVAVALIAAVATLGAVVIPILATKFRDRRDRSLTDRLLDQLEERNTEIADLRAENAELRRMVTRRRQ